MDAKLFGLLARGQVEEYRIPSHAARRARPRLAWDEKWGGGPVSVHADGSVLAIRLYSLGDRKAKIDVITPTAAKSPATAALWHFPRFALADGRLHPTCRDRRTCHAPSGQEADITDARRHA
ncbi:hypothetical protein [Streptomyces sp. NPDC054797]